MNLKVEVGNSSNEVRDFLNHQVDLAVASSGAGEPFREQLLSEISALIKAGREDVIVPEPCVCPATGSLSFRLTAGSGFKVAIENAYLHSRPSIH